MIGVLASMPKGHSSLGQVVRRQLDRHAVACQHLYVVLAHLARQVSQHLVAFGYLDFERRVAHALNDGSFNGDHIFFWNNITSFSFVARAPSPRRLFSRYKLKRATHYRQARLVLNDRADDERSLPISLVSLICSSDRPSLNPLTFDR